MVCSLAGLDTDSKAVRINESYRFVEPSQECVKAAVARRCDARRPRRIEAEEKDSVTERQPRVATRIVGAVETVASDRLAAELRRTGQDRLHVVGRMGRRER